MNKNGFIWIFFDKKRNFCYTIFIATVSTYLNFKRETEAAFNFYKSVFGTEFIGEFVPVKPQSFLLNLYKV